MSSFMPFYFCATYCTLSSIFQHYAMKSALGTVRILLYHEVFFKGGNRRRWAKPLHRINVPPSMLMAGRSTL